MAVQGGLGSIQPDGPSHFFFQACILFDPENEALDPQRRAASNFKLYLNHLGAGWLTAIPVNDSVGMGRGLSICISNNFWLVWGPCLRTTALAFLRIWSNGTFAEYVLLLYFGGIKNECESSGVCSASAVTPPYFY